SCPIKAAERRLPSASCVSACASSGRCAVPPGAATAERVAKHKPASPISGEQSDRHLSAGASRQTGRSQRFQRTRIWRQARLWVNAVPTPAFMLARVFAGDGAGVAAFVRLQQSGDDGRGGCFVTDGALCRGALRTLATRPLREPQVARSGVSPLLPQ